MLVSCTSILHLIAKLLFPQLWIFAIHLKWKGKKCLSNYDTFGPGKTERHDRIYVPSFYDPYELQNCDVATSYPYKMLSISYNSTEILKEKDQNSTFDLECIIQLSFLTEIPPSCSSVQMFLD